MPQDVAEMYAEYMIALAGQARGCIRDLNPKNELHFLRVRTKNKEIMVAYGE
jgi:dynein light chain roadblock-type